MNNGEDQQTDPPKNNYKLDWTCPMQRKTKCQYLTVTKNMRIFYKILRGITKPNSIHNQYIGKNL